MLTPDQQAITQNLKSKIEAWLPDRYRQALAIVTDEGQRRGLAVYIMCGFVRDVLLGRPNLDVDIAVAGDAIALAHEVAERINANSPTPIASVTTHPQFGTASLNILDHAEQKGKATRPAPAKLLDFATTRRETYATPAALPTVSFVDDITVDLARRDFSINALVVRLGDYALIDPYGGLSDLNGKLIRVLHEASFRDDPTRIFRAVRYEQRLGFQIETHTEQLLVAAVSGGLIALLSPDRVRHELERVLREDRAATMLARLAELGALAAIHPTLRWDDWLAMRVAAVARTEPPDLQAAIALILLTYRLSDEQRGQIADRLNLGAEMRAMLAAAHHLRGQITDLYAAPRNSDIYHLMHSYGDTVLLATTYALASYGAAAPPALTDAVNKIDRYRRELAHVKPELDGNYLANLGLPPGKAYKPILDELLRARLDGEVTDRATEAALLQQLVNAAKGA